MKEELQLVIVVEHRDHVCVNLQLLLQAGPYLVKLAKTMKAAEKLVRGLEASCILLLENDMPEGKGVDLLPRLLALSNHALNPILLCQNDDIVLRVAAMAVGAKYTYAMKAGYKLFYLQVEQVRKQIEDQQRGKIDRLTSIYSQSYGLELAESVIKRLYHHVHVESDRRKQGRRALSCLMFDLDYFKSINDNHGHHMGNEALRFVVTSAKKHLRNSDIFWRAGGDEFMILLPGLAQKKAEERARLIADELRKATFGGELQLSVNASIGVVTLCEQDITTDDHHATLQNLLRRADEAMYEVKNRRKGN